MQYKYAILPSKIEGYGVVATSNYKKNEVVGLAIDSNTVNPNITSHLGKWVNHSYNPTCRLHHVNGRYYLVTNRNFWRGEELTSNYNLAPDFIARAKSHYR